MLPPCGRHSPRDASRLVRSSGSRLLALVVTIEKLGRLRGKTAAVQMAQIKTNYESESSIKYSKPPITTRLNFSLSG